MIETVKYHQHVLKLLDRKDWQLLRKLRQGFRDGVIPGFIYDARLQMFLDAKFFQNENIALETAKNNKAALFIVDFTGVTHFIEQF